MSDREAFVSAIAANPDDDLLRLVFADWLEEHGDPERAEFIRTQIRWHHAFPDERKELDIKANGLFRVHAHRWFGPFVTSLTPTFDPAIWSDVYPFQRPAECITLPNPPPRPMSAAPVPSKLKGFRFRIDRGFVSHMDVGVGPGEGRISIAEAFRQEPLHQLTCHGELHSSHWARLTDSCLRRVTKLILWQSWAWSDDLPEYSVFLTDPHLANVRQFTLFPYRTIGIGTCDHPLPVAWVEQFVRSPLASRLTRLHLPNIIADGIHPLCHSGRLNLERLELSGRFTADNVRQLGGSVLASTLQELKLEYAQLGDDGVTALIRDNWQRLTHLGLRGNRLTPASLSTLAKAVFTPRLVKLDLSGNSLFKDLSSSYPIFDDDLDSAQPPNIDEHDMSRLHKLAVELDSDRLEHLDLTDTGLSHVPDFLGERFGERVTV